MSNQLYREMLEQGLVTPEEYEQYTGEKIGDSKGPVLASPGLVSTPVAATKEDAAEVEARREKMKALGIDPGGYKQPDPQQLARAEAVAARDYPGDGFRCPSRRERVRTCPVGNVFACEQHLRCEFTAALMSRTGGKRSVGNMYIAPDADPDAPIKTEPEAVEQETIVERVGNQSQHKGLNDQALAIFKMRREAAQRRKS